MTEPEDNPIRKRRPKTGHRKPPVIGGFSTKNSWTSPKRIAQRKKEAEALALREQAYSYAQIAAHMSISAKTACKLVFKAMDRLTPIETAERVRTLELARLNSIQSEIWENVIDGDLAAIHAYLRLSDQRSRLLGLYPKDGAMVQIGVSGNDVDGIAITFVTPQHKLHPSQPDVSPSPYAGQPPDLSRPAIAPPPERRRGPLGWLEEARNPPDSTSWMK
jgi:hypothetical protein